MPVAKKRTKRSPWWIPAGSIFAPIAILACLMFYNYNANEVMRAEVAEEQTKRQAHEVEAAREAERMRKIAWVLPAPPAREISYNGQMPEPPTLPPIRYVTAQGQRKMTGESLSERLFVLVDGHPVEEIRTDMNALINTGQIMLSWQAEKGLSARFLTITPQNVAWMQRKQKIASEQPVLMINPDWLASLSTEKDVFSALLVVYHEFQHYKQWLTAPPKDRLIMLSGTTGGIADKYGLTQEDACNHMWRAEREAYALECELALSWNHKDAVVFGEFCDYVGTSEWDHALFMVLYGSGPLYREQCGRTIGKLAGHPYPELL